MSLFHSFKVQPQRSWTLEETKIPLQRAWTVEETKIPHRPNSAVRAPRRDFRGAVVVNPSFQKRYNESEEDMEPQVMETPPVPHGPHRVAIKRENINVVRQCEWDVKSIKDGNLGEKTLLSKKLSVLIGVVCVTSIVSLVLTLLILFGSVEAGNCSCGGNKGVAGTNKMKSVDDDRIEKVSENMTTMNGRLEKMEGSNKEREQKLQKLLQETKRSKTLLQEQENKIKNLTYRLESTQDELQSLEDQLAVQMAALWNTTTSTTVQLSRLKSVWIAVNITAEKTFNLTAKMDQEFKNVKRSANETNGTLNKLTLSLQGFKSQISNGMDRVWLNLNQSRKCCTNLTTFLKSFKANVTYRSERLEVRIENEEQKSSNTSKVTERNLKKIHDLQSLLNVTRQDAREMSRQHFIALRSAGNLTKKEIHRVWTALNTSQAHLLGKLRKVKDNLTEQMNNEMETVWINLNQSRRCCTNLTTFLKSFKAKVTYRSERLEARIKSEEQKSNSTSKVTEKNLKKIQDLQSLLNATRQDAKEVSWQHLTALWSAGNRTKKEIQRVWTTVNTSQVHILEKLRKVKDNVTEQLNLTAVLLQASDASLLASLVNVNSSITEKVNNVSKMAGPIGPPGFNGSQGPAGPAGSVGLPGPKGSGDFSSCQYKVVTETLTPGDSVIAVPLAEPNGKRVLGVSCSTNYAAEYNLFHTIHINANRYSCICRGSSTEFSPFGGQQKSCYLHYWECPLTN